MEGRKTAIVVMHGIGQQEQLKTLRDFSSSLATADGAPQPTEFSRRTVSAGDQTSAYFTTETDAKTQTERRERIAIGEFYWADLSELATGMFSSLRNFFILQSNLPDIALASFDPETVAGEPRDHFLLRLVRALITLMMWTIYVPIFALNAAYAVVISVIGLRMNLGAYFEAIAYRDAAGNIFKTETILEPDGSQTVRETDLVTFVNLPIDDGVYGVLLIAAIFFFGLSKALAAFRHAVIISIWAIGFIFLLTLLLVLGRFGVIGEWPTHKAAADDIRLLFNYLWWVPIGILAIYLASLPIMWATLYKRWRAVTISFFALFVATMFWLLFYVFVWLSIFNQIFKDSAFEELLLPLNDALPTFSANLVALLSVVVLMIWSLFVHVIRSSKARHSPRATRWRFPRLIISSAAIFASVVSASAWLTVTFECRDDPYRIVNEQTGELGPRNYLTGDLLRAQLDPICDTTEQVTSSILENTVLMLVLLGFIGSYSTSGIDTATDIVNYFKADRGHRKAWLHQSLASVWRTPHPEGFEVRERQRARLRAVVDDLTAQAGPFDRTIFIAHSLGTMVAIDFLREESADQAGKLGEISLVTMGSPYTNVFNYYFPHLFPPVSGDFIPGLKRWVNIYRENDYVGTRLTPKSSDAVHEIEQPARGHLGYFADIDVAKEIAWHVLERQDA